MVFNLVFLAEADKLEVAISLTFLLSHMGLASLCLLFGLKHTACLGFLYSVFELSTNSLKTSYDLDCSFSSYFLDFLIFM